MKFKILAGLALTTAALAACKVDVIEDVGGFGGSADVTTGSTTGGSTKTTGASTTGNTSASTTNVQASTTATTTSGTACVDEATCEDCQNCAVAGECAEELADCQAASCFDLNTCLVMCNGLQDNPATPDNEINQCICGVNDLTECDTAAPAGGCIQMHNAAVPSYFGLVDCLFGTDGMSGECGARPDCQ